jgi:hypothetical protein
MHTLCLSSKHTRGASDQVTFSADHGAATLLDATGTACWRNREACGRGGTADQVTPELGIWVPQNGLPLLMVTNWLPSTLVMYLTEFGLRLAEVVEGDRRGEEALGGAHATSWPGRGRVKVRSLIIK